LIDWRGNRYSVPPGIGWPSPQVVAIEEMNVGHATVAIKGYSVLAVRGGMSCRPIRQTNGAALSIRLDPAQSGTWYADARDAQGLTSWLNASGRSANSVRVLVSLATGEERFRPRLLRRA